jgi:hypothetical protein
MHYYLIPLITVDAAAVHIQELVENIPDLAVLAEPLLIVRRVLREQIVIPPPLAGYRAGWSDFVRRYFDIGQRASSRYRFFNT